MEEKIIIENSSKMILTYDHIENAIYLSKTHYKKTQIWNIEKNRINLNKEDLSLDIVEQETNNILLLWRNNDKSTQEWVIEEGIKSKHNNLFLTYNEMKGVFLYTKNKIMNQDWTIINKTDYAAKVIQRNYKKIKRKKIFFGVVKRKKIIKKELLDQKHKKLKLMNEIVLNEKDILQNLSLILEIKGTLEKKNLISFDSLFIIFKNSKNFNSPKS
jgi:hypothetical protein